MKLSEYKGDFIHFKCGDMFSGICRTEDLIDTLMNLCGTVEKLHMVVLTTCEDEADQLTNDVYTKPSEREVTFTKIDMDLLEKLMEAM